MIALYLSTRTLHFIGRWVWRNYLCIYFDDYHPQSGYLTHSPDNAGKPKRFFSFARKSSSPTTSRSVSPTASIALSATPAANPTLDDHDDEIKNHHHTRKWLRQTIGCVFFEDFIDC